MPTKKFKPVTPGSRFRLVSKHEEITRSEPERSLLEPMHKSGGRNHHGRITSRRRGGGARRAYRRIDFKRDKFGIPGRVAEIEYDPNRSAYIALIHYADGEKRYMLHARGLKQGDTVVSGPGSDIRVGNAVPLAEVPLGTVVHNLELRPGAGGRIVRSAGNAAQVMAKEGGFVTLRLPSTEVRMVRGECLATIGEVGNTDHEQQVIGKAGANRWRGKRPKVRGVAMNPIDHPLGGGEGKTSGGRPACSPWGKPEGVKTRKHKKETNKYIVRGRKRGKSTGGG
ncbi:MAG: 50S ribosomal protein L2 [Longimicrobiales bacterium]